MTESTKKKVTWGLRIFLGAFFLFSAYAKLHGQSMNAALGTFEAKQLIPMGFSEGFAPYFSRFIIAAEFSIGIGLFQPHFLKRFVVPVAILLLALFSIQLTYEWITFGVKEDCGCFGVLLPFNTWESLLKNIVSIGLFVWLWKLLEPDNKESNHWTYPALIFTTVAMWMYAAAPIQKKVDVPLSNVPQGQVHSDFADVETNDTDTSTVVTNDTTNTETQDNETPEVIEPPKPKGPPKVKSKFSDFPAYIPPGIKVDEGRKILCFFAAGCEHCQATAKALTEMRSEVANMPPMHIVFMDEDVGLIPDFFKIAGREYSYTVADVADFWKMLDFSRDTPGVCYLYNGNIMYFADGINEKEFKKADLKAALKKEKL